MRAFSLSVLLLLVSTAFSSASLLVDRWTFDEDGSGFASQVSDNGTGLPSGIFGASDPVASDGGYTLNSTNVTNTFTGAVGFPSGTPVLSTANGYQSLEVEYTFNSLDFSGASTPPNTQNRLFLRVKEGATNLVNARIQSNANNGIIEFEARPGGTRVTLVNSLTSGPLTIGYTLDYSVDEYRFWEGTSGNVLYTESIANLGDSAIPDGIQFGIQEYDNGVFVFDSITVAAAVPEPSTTLFVAFGMAGCAAIRRRRRSIEQ